MTNLASTTFGKALIVFPCKTPSVIATSQLELHHLLLLLYWVDSILTMPRGWGKLQQNHSSTVKILCTASCQAVDMLLLAVT